jgi:CheY-like chemotaxis protein
LKPGPRIINLFIVDDDPDDIFMFRHAIEEMQIACRIASFANGKELMNYVEKHVRLPDVIVLDLNMPLVDGYGTLKKLKDDPELKKIPVFVLSVSHNPRDKERCKKLGCAKYYTKPADLDGYFPIVEDMITNLHFS